MQIACYQVVVCSLHTAKYTMSHTEDARTSSLSAKSANASTATLNGQQSAPMSRKRPLPPSLINEEEPPPNKRIHTPTVSCENLFQLRNNCSYYTNCCNFVRFLFSFDVSCVYIVDVPRVNLFPHLHTHRRRRESHF